MNNSVPARLLLFAKAPVAGRVKTRLQPALAAAQSVLLHRLLVEHTLSIVTALRRSAVRLELELWVDQPHPWWQQLQREYPHTLFFQRGASLGERMQHAAQNALGRSPKVVIIGTDCPYINAQYLQQALDGLDRGPLVIGPAEDGGYVLIALRDARPGLFTGVDWGSDQVLRQTRENIQREGLSWLELASLSDIDRPEDLSRFIRLMPALAAQLEFLQIDPDSGGLMV